jgi:hypothetical protein
MTSLTITKHKTANRHLLQGEGQGSKGRSPHDCDLRCHRCHIHDDVLTNVLETEQLVVRLCAMDLCHDHRLGRSDDGLLLPARWMPRELHEIAKSLECAAKDLRIIHRTQHAHLVLSARTRPSSLHKCDWSRPRHYLRRSRPSSCA